MKSFVLLLVLALSGACFGESDNTIVTAGEWSAAVRDDAGYVVRGRLIVRVCSQTQATQVGGIIQIPDFWPDASVHLELEVRRDTGGPPIEFDMQCLHCELHDASDRPVQPNALLGKKELGFSRMQTGCNSTAQWGVSLCIADLTRTADPKLPTGFRIAVTPGVWVLPPGDTNSYYLSGTFSLPTNHIASSTNHTWGGILRLPKVKVGPHKS